MDNEETVSIELPENYKFLRVDDQIEVFCPNCGTEMILFMDESEFKLARPGCGDCAQAGVRPRELYRLLLDPGRGAQEAL